MARMKALVLSALGRRFDFENIDVAQSVRLHAVAESFTAAKEAATTKIGADF
jgi:hypothetical protein